MSRLITILLLLATTTLAVAQKPWGEYSEKQQRRTLLATYNPDVMRRALSDIESLSPEEHKALWEVVSEPTKGKRLASLYLHLYEVMRPAGHDAAVEDMVILRAYPKYMLRRWACEGHSFDPYYYAYAVGFHCAMTEDKAGLDELCRLLTKSSSRRTRALAESFTNSAHMAMRSVALDRELVLDYTPFATNNELLVDVTESAYGSVDTLYDAIATGYEFSAEEIIIAEECIKWSDAYCLSTLSSGVDGVELVYILDNLDASISLTDVRGDGYLLPSHLYILPSGALFALDVDNGWVIDGVVVGEFSDGELQLLGRQAINDSQLKGVKCNNEGLYLHTEGEDGVRYYFVEAN